MPSWPLPPKVNVIGPWALVRVSWKTSAPGCGWPSFTSAARTRSDTRPERSFGAMLRADSSVPVPLKREPSEVRNTLPAYTSSRRRLTCPWALVATTSTVCLPSLRPFVSHV